MDFDWNETNRNHIAGHRISPEEAEQVVKNEPIDVTRKATTVKNGSCSLEKPMRDEFSLWSPPGGVRRFA